MRKNGTTCPADTSRSCSDSKKSLSDRTAAGNDEETLIIFASFIKNGVLASRERSHGTFGKLAAVAKFKPKAYPPAMIAIFWIRADNHSSRFARHDNLER
jgi:hypothetical protein